MRCRCRRPSQKSRRRPRRSHDAQRRNTRRHDGHDAGLRRLSLASAAMSALAPSALAALLATCAPDAPANYLTAIVRAESGLHPYAIHDNTAQTSLFPETYEQAVAMARDMLRQGHSLDVGLMQVNVSNWNWLGLTAETALDPCQNVAAGARVFEAFSRYNTGDPRRGFANGYVQRVVANQRLSPAAFQAEQPKEPPREPYDIGGGDDQLSTTVYEGKK